MNSAETLLAFDDVADLGVLMSPAHDMTNLISAARMVRANAYAPYSNFLVGAAVLTSANSIFAGANVENASFGLTCCAERVAVFNAISAGQSDIVAVAIATEGGHAPCGACCQVLAELAANARIMLVDCAKSGGAKDGGVQEFRMADLLPHAFGRKELLGRERGN